MGGEATAGRGLEQPGSIRAVRASDHDRQAGAFGGAAQGVLAVFGGVADVVIRRDLGGRETFPEAADDSPRLGHAQRRLRHETGRRLVETIDLLHRFDDRDPARRFAFHSDHLVVTAMPDQDHAGAGRGEALRLVCTLRTSGQVASITVSRRRALCSRTSGATPCALKSSVAPNGTSSTDSTNTTPQLSNALTT